MTVWIRLVYGSEKVKDQDVDEAHGKSEGVYSKGGVLHILFFCVFCCLLMSASVHNLVTVQRS